jgi:hypothetical protein
MAKSVRLNAKQGNTFSFTVFLKDPVTELAYDLTGKSLVFYVNSPTPISKNTGTVGSGFVITNAVGGQATLTLSAGETRLLEFGSYQYEVELRYNGTQTTIMEGAFYVAKGFNID